MTEQQLRYEFELLKKIYYEQSEYCNSAEPGTLAFEYQCELRELAWLGSKYFGIDLSFNKYKRRI